MTDRLELSPAEARDYLLAKKRGKIRVSGLLDLRNVEIEKLSASISCYDLDASGSSLKSLPDDISIESPLTLDNCKRLESLPVGLKCGSISLQNCNYLSELPERLNTWFLDLTGCQNFSAWPKKATIEHGIMRLRNCININSLPGWLKSLAQLDVSGCVQLDQVPKQLSISSWIDVGGTNIKELPESLANTPLRWRGVPVNQRIAFHPETLTSKEILNEPNAETRRVMIERMGYLKFANEAKAVVVDQDTDPGGQRQLLQIELEGDEPLLGLVCHCPSTGRQYFLRVPPNIKKCHAAAAWMAGFDDPEKYKPIVET